MKEGRRREKRLHGKPSWMEQERRRPLNDNYELEERRETEGRLTQT